MMLPQVKGSRPTTISTKSAIVLFLAVTLCCITSCSVDAAFHCIASPQRLTGREGRLIGQSFSRHDGNPHNGGQQRLYTASWHFRNEKNVKSTPAAAAAATQLSSSIRDSSQPTPNFSSSKTRVTAVYALILCNLGVFLADKVFRMPFVTRQLYLFHSRWYWWQPLTSCFCHADRRHLSNNLFLLLLFGRSVEDDLGWGGLVLSYVFCGVLASLTSLLMLPTATVSIGASGAVFGLFAVSTLTKLSWKELLDWRKLVEVAVLGEFVFRQLASEMSTAAQGGTAGINHVAHLSGAAAGVIMVLGMRAIVANFERSEKREVK
jgi:membrane associated rhomboid family serine protease